MSPYFKQLFGGLLRLAIGLMVVGGIFAWIAAWLTRPMMEEARVFRVHGDFEQLETMTEMFLNRHHRLPTTEEGLAVFVRRPSTWPPNENWRRLMEEPLRDPWRREYLYEALPESNGFRLRSLGPDKKSADDDIILTWPKQPAKVRAPVP